jgi:hypothetical protein
MKLVRGSCIAFILSLLVFYASGAYAQQGPPQGPPPPPASGITTDGLYLFVMSGDSLYQYSSSDLSLVTTVKLPRPAPPEDNNTQMSSSALGSRWAEKFAKIRAKFSSADAAAGSDNQTQPPPPPPGGSGLCTDGTYLFKLRGHSISQYTIADMTLVKSVELPKPELPTTAE